jgi:hypothetical protein
MRRVSRTRLLEIVQWVRGLRALGRGVAEESDSPRALAALEAMEQLGGLVAATAQPQAERARRLAPDIAGEPVALLAAARALRFYLPLEPGTEFEIDATLVPEEGELAVVTCEVRRPNGDRVARGELRFLLVPGTGEHAREAKTRDKLRASLGVTNW